VERHPSIIRASHCVARLMERFSCVVSNTSLTTGTLSIIIRKTWIADPTGISEHLDRYLLAFSAAIIFSLIFSEKRVKNKNHREICSR
jgi:xanthine/uracil/vitamin C permease (AzgA family)